jgi:hypothetical protein
MMQNQKKIGKVSIWQRKQLYSLISTPNQELGRVNDEHLEGCMRIATTEMTSDIER